jgi:nickel/cobalt transporter (NiCoT) family protein
MDAATQATAARVEKLLAGLPYGQAIPRERGEVTFDAPWELHTLALGVAAHGAGGYRWPDFQQMLTDSIRCWEAAGPERSQWQYYERWLHALERLLAGCGVIDLAELDERSQAELATSPGCQPSARPSPSGGDRARFPVAVHPAAGSRLRRMGADLSGRERGRLVLMFGFILLVNAIGWGIFVLYVMPHHFDYKGVGGSRGLGVGLGVAITAWFLGFRHAFDADHISCIDNTTRKLMADGKRPLGTGFFFSFGHSTIVVVVGVGITVAARAVFGAMVDPSSAYETAGGAIGTVVSAGFLYLIALLNLIVLSGIFKVFREMRLGTYNEAQLETQLQARGLMYRFFGRFMRSITRTWQLYFVGLVFGIGFDTATEVVLLAATAYAAIQGLPYFAVLALPFLFSGGMMLLDTLDGAFMNFAYGWAFARPVRKVYYNLVITGLSIGAAFIIGTIEILGVMTTELHLSGPFWNTMAGFNINVAGFCIAGLFVLVWAAALAYWRLGRVENRWTARVAAAPTQRPGAAPKS